MSSLVKDLSDGVRLIQLMVSNRSLTNFTYIDVKSFLRYLGNHGYCRHAIITLRIGADYRRRIGGISLGRYNKNPRMRVQKAENVNMALEFITSRGVKLTNIGPEGTFLYLFYDSFNWLLLDIIDGNLKLILGMIWTLILRFTIADIRFVLFPGMIQHLFDLFIPSFPKAKKASLRKKGYSSGVNARRNLTKKSTCRISHIVGLMGLHCSCAFSYPLLILTEISIFLRCALIHCHRPDLLDYNKLDKVSVLSSLPTIFIDHLDYSYRQIDMVTLHWRLELQSSTLASRYIHIFRLFHTHTHRQLLEVEDLCDSARPYERSVVIYIASYCHAFSTMGETNE